MQKGTVSVQTENIFPIIKRYLYSDQEIFLRELVANAVDATQKLKTLAAKGQNVGDIDDLVIEVSVDKKEGTLTISDCGIGMTHEEVEKYITQIAFSGAEEFLKQYDDTHTVIGHFGLGFFSAFMVADKVEIRTKSWQKDTKGVQWISEGGIEYQIGEYDKTTRGTDIVLYLSDEAQEYLEDHKVQGLLTKYCRFLPIDIQFGTTTQTIPVVPNDTENKTEQEEQEEQEEPKEETFEVPNIINNTKPLWMQKPADLKEEDYISFYKELYPNSEDPLFWIHLNVDYPFKLTGVLFFPKLKHNLEVRKDRIHLYCNQVFVTDQVEQIVPDFLMLLHGVIDSPDIPLNVSRSYLQSDPEVKKINKYITKKVADKLKDLFKKEREGFEQKWENIGLLVKYGMLTDEKFFERVDDFCLYETTDGKMFTFDELKETTKDLQTDKNDRLVQLYATEVHDQHSYIEAAKDKGFVVLKLTTTLDPHFLQFIEGKKENTNFKRVDADTPDQLIEKENVIESVLNEEQTNTVNDLFKNTVNDERTSVLVKAMTPNDSPVVITRPEFMRRMKDMAHLSGDNYMSNMPDMYNVVVNANHPTVSTVLNENDQTKQKEAVKQLYDLALLQQGMLKGEALTKFINRSFELIK